MITGLCAKVTTKSTIITKDGSRFFGMNWCADPQPKCPREAGEDYTKCKTICGQYGHSEVMACRMAGIKAAGSTLYLEGHTYACDSCMAVALKHGVKEIIVGPPPEIKGAPPLSNPRKEGEAHEIEPNK